MVKEKNYYADICRYYVPRAQKAGCSMAIEVKKTNNDYISFSCLPAHQERFLLESERAYAYKIPDIGPAQKPGDIMLLASALSVLIIVFYKPRKEQVFEITIRDFIKERESSERKSLTLERAREIGTQIYL